MKYIGEVAFNAAQLGGNFTVMGNTITSTKDNIVAELVRRADENETIKEYLLVEVGHVRTEWEAFLPGDTTILTSTPLGFYVIQEVPDDYEVPKEETQETTQ